MTQPGIFEIGKQRLNSAIGMSGGKREPRFEPKSREKRNLSNSRTSAHMADIQRLRSRSTVLFARSHERSQSLQGGRFAMNRRDCRCNQGRNVAMERESQACSRIWFRPGNTHDPGGRNPAPRRKERSTGRTRPPVRCSSECRGKTGPSRIAPCASRAEFHHRPQLQV